MERILQDISQFLQNSDETCGSVCFNIRKFISHNGGYQIASGFLSSNEVTNIIKYFLKNTLISVTIALASLDHTFTILSYQKETYILQAYRNKYPLRIDKIADIYSFIDKLTYLAFHNKHEHHLELFYVPFPKRKGKEEEIEYFVDIIPPSVFPRNCIPSTRRNSKKDIF